MTPRAAPGETMIGDASAMTRRGCALGLLSGSLVLFAGPVAAQRGNQPCSGRKGGVSH